MATVDEAKREPLPLRKRDLPGVLSDSDYVVETPRRFPIDFEHRTTLEKSAVDFGGFDAPSAHGRVQPRIEGINGVHLLAIPPGEFGQFRSASTHIGADLDDIPLETAQVPVLHECDEALISH